MFTRDPFVRIISSDASRKRVLVITETDQIKNGQKGKVEPEQDKVSDEVRQDGFVERRKRFYSV